MSKKKKNNKMDNILLVEEKQHKDLYIFCIIFNLFAIIIFSKVCNMFIIIFSSIKMGKSDYWHFIGEFYGCFAVFRPCTYCILKMEFGGDDFLAVNQFQLLQQIGYWITHPGTHREVPNRTNISLR